MAFLTRHPRKTLWIVVAPLLSDRTWSIFAGVFRIGTAVLVLVWTTLGGGCCYWHCSCSAPSVPPPLKIHYVEASPC